MSEIYSIDFAGRPISVKANYVAGQASGAVLVTYGETVVLVTAVSEKSKRENIDFLPLTVDYQEMTYAAGKIPGGFFKREGRPNEKETLTSRMVDRSIRPLIPKGYFYETQIVASVLSFDNENGSDVAAMLGASTALGISDVPFDGPIAGVRVGRVGGTFICNPSWAETGESDLDIFLVGRKVVPGIGGNDYDVNLVMLEGGAREVSEDVLVDAINFGLDSMRPVMELQDQIVQAIGKVKRPFESPELDDELQRQVFEAAEEMLKDAYTTPVKMDRSRKLSEVRDEMLSKFASEDGSKAPMVKKILEDMGKKILRNMIVHEKKRIDGRNSADIRSISSEVGLLPRTHG